MKIETDLMILIRLFPAEITNILKKHLKKNNLLEIILDLGRRPEARFSFGTQYLSIKPVSWQDLEYITKRIGKFSDDNRTGIELTLHRISCIRNRQGMIIGLTCRIGRSLIGKINIIRDLLASEKSLLILGKPGVGKTTLVREISRVLSDELEKRVVIIDSSNEIAGNSDIPHPGIGKARRMQVSFSQNQHDIMIEAIENHMPEVIIVDEIGTELESLAARTIAERGVQLIGTAHGNYLENLIKNPTLSNLIGGIQNVILGDEEAKRRNTKKSVLERKTLPAFQMAIEINQKTFWIIHQEVGEAIDFLLLGKRPNSQIRFITFDGKIKINSLKKKMNKIETFKKISSTDFGKIQKSNKLSLRPKKLKTKKIYIYIYLLSKIKIQKLGNNLKLNFELTTKIENADIFLTLHSFLKYNTKFKYLANKNNLLIYSIKNDTNRQITKTLSKISLLLS